VAIASLFVAMACAGEPPTSDDPIRIDRTVPVMGTVLRLSAWAPDDATARRANEAGRAEVFLVDSLMSHYRPESEISRLTDGAGTAAWTELSPSTLEVLASALDWARRSGGAFDPTVGPLMHAWGFFQHEPARPAPGAAADAAALVDHTRVELDPAGSRARLRTAGMRLDLGALAKGYALDLALAAMDAAGATSAMVDLGGNVAVRGPGPADDGRWTLGIRHPRVDGRLAGTLRVAGGSVATSGDYEQMFEHEGVRYSHLMDPRLGEPARGVVSVTVAAPDGMSADALSTLLFVLGPDEGEAFLRRESLDDEVTAVWILDGPPAGDLPGDLPGDVIVHRGAGVTVELEPPGL
jgi:thiamine biosynthesis lipoprotein